MGVLTLGAALIAVVGCGNTPSVEVQSAEPVVERSAPDWPEPDMAIWHFAKSKGVHGNDISRHAVDDYGFFRVRDKPAEVPPIHAGPPPTPSIWVVRSGEVLFDMDDPAMARVLMTKSADALVRVYSKVLSWMGSSDAHAITQNQSDGVTSLTWVHDRKEYPPMGGPNWERVTVTSTTDGTRVDTETLKDYIRPE